MAVETRHCHCGSDGYTQGNVTIEANSFCAASESLFKLRTHEQGFRTLKSLSMQLKWSYKSCYDCNNNREKNKRCFRNTFYISILILRSLLMLTI
jgi:hypothetical protein